MCSVCQNFSSAHDALNNIFPISFPPFPLPCCSVGLHRLDAGLPCDFSGFVVFSFMVTKLGWWDLWNRCLYQELCFWRSWCLSASSLFWKPIIFFSRKFQMTIFEIPLPVVVKPVRAVAVPPMTTSVVGNKLMGWREAWGGSWKLLMNSCKVLWFVIS